MKAFNGDPALKKKTLFDAALARMGGHFYGWGHYWHPYLNGKCRGNVTGALLNPYLPAGKIEQELPMLWEPVLGIPWQVGELADEVFSMLCCHKDKSLADAWAEVFLDAIRPGADLSRVTDAIIAQVLEQPEWLAAYADEESAHGIGYMSGVFTLRLNGINQAKRIEDFYWKNIDKKHQHRFRTTQTDAPLVNYPWAALRSLCSIGKHRGPLGYFLSYAVTGSARHLRVDKDERVNVLVARIIQMIKDC